MTPVELDKWAESKQKPLQRFFNDKGVMPPTAVLMVTRDPKTKKAIKPTELPVFVNRIDSESAKDGWSEFIRAKCVELKAVAIIIFFEAWMMMPDSPEHAKEVERLHETMSLEHVEGRKEVIHLSYERKGRSRAWYSEIFRVPGAIAKASAFESFPDSGVSAGRFANFLSTDQQ